MNAAAQAAVFCLQTSGPTPRTLTSPVCLMRSRLIAAQLHTFYTQTKDFQLISSKTQQFWGFSEVFQTTLHREKCVLCKLLPAIACKTHSKGNKTDATLPRERRVETRFSGKSRHQVAFTHSISFFAELPSWIFLVILVELMQENDLKTTWKCFNSRAEQCF